MCVCVCAYYTVHVEAYQLDERASATRRAASEQIRDCTCMVRAGASCSGRGRRLSSQNGKLKNVRGQVFGDECAHRDVLDACADPVALGQNLRAPRAPGST